MSRWLQFIFLLRQLAQDRFKLRLAQWVHSSVSAVTCQMKSCVGPKLLQSGRRRSIE